jgi:hypothetical protein
MGLKLHCLVGMGLLMASCHGQDFVRFRPVYREGDRLVRSDAPVSADLRDRMKIVLAFYDVSFQQDDKGELWIAAKAARDLDLMWNYTSKANDAEWVTKHASNSSPAGGG